MTKNLLYRMLVIISWLLVCNNMQAQENRREFWVYDSSNGLADNSAQTIKCTKTGRMVITTIGHINFFDGYTFAHIDPTPKDVFPLPRYNGHYHLYFDKHHHLWLKDKQSVTCLDLLLEQFISDVGGVFREMGMTQPVEDMFGDQNNQMWFRSGNMLYCKELGCEMPIDYDSELFDVDVFNQEMLLQFYTNGMTRAYDLKTRRHLFDAPAYEGVDTALYNSSGVLLPHDHGYYQIRNGEQHGILLNFDVTTRQWKVLMEEPYHLNNMVEHQGRLYIASEYGYWVYDIQTGATEHVAKLALSKGRTLETDINALCFDRQGGMWIGTEKRGLLYAKPYPSPFHVYSWTQPEALHYYNLLEQAIGPEKGRLERRLNCLFKDSRGWTWRGTYTGVVLEKGNGELSHVYGQREGLTNEVVHCITEAANHDIWIGTSYGITRLFIKGDSVNHIESYVGSDNVPVESFVNGRAHCMPDGTIIMQALDHMVVFNPSDFHHEHFTEMAISPKMVRVLVNGIDVKAGMLVDGQLVLERAVTRVKYINVNYDQNSISLTFSSLNYFRPIQTYYRVRVKGVSGFNDWQILSYANSGGLVDKHGMLHLPLMGIKPGRYEVEVQSSMSPDSWKQEPYIWVVNVEEPWWRTTGVYLSLLLVLLLLAIANFIVFNSNLKLRIKRNNEESDILRSIKGFADRCNMTNTEVLTPYTDTGEGDEKNVAFLNVMSQIVPYVNSHRSQQFSVRDLAHVTGMETSELYRLLSNNLYKSPRSLMTRLRVQQARKLMDTTDLTLTEIAERCNFVSPNYLIASFYHLYRQTPEDYRNSAAR